MSIDSSIGISENFDISDGVKDSNVVLSSWPGLLYKSYGNSIFKAIGYRNLQNIIQLYQDREGGLLHKKVEYGIGLVLGTAINILARSCFAVYAASQSKSLVAGTAAFVAPEIATTLAGIVKTIHRKYEIKEELDL